MGESYIDDFTSKHLMPSLKIENPKGKIRYSNLKSVHDWQIFTEKCFLKKAEVQQTFENLHNIILFLSNVRISNKLKEHNIDRLDIIFYHIENFYFRLLGAFDRILIFIFTVYEFKIDEKHINKNKIINDNKIQKFGREICESNNKLYMSLLKIIDFSNEFIKIRNKLVHREHYFELRFRYSKLLSLTLKLKEKDDEMLKILPVMKLLYKSTIDSEVKVIKNEFYALISEYQILWDDILIESELEFHKRILGKVKIDPNFDIDALINHKSPTPKKIKNKIVDK